MGGGLGVPGREEAGKRRGDAERLAAAVSLPGLGRSAGLRVCVKCRSGALAARIGGGRDSKDRPRSVRGDSGGGADAEPSLRLSPSLPVFPPPSSILVPAKAW